jgi:tRNA threonylcarbamoyladenosine biosynthesis protein TsaE
MFKIMSNSAQDTAMIGYKLGSILKKNDIICLMGGLGAGKTAFTGGIASALGITGYITSPTFTIINEYRGRLPLYHFDVYRIDDPDEMFEVGFDEYICGEGIVVIEWADLIKDILPKDHIKVNIEKVFDEGADQRSISMEFIGGRYEQYEGDLTNEVIGC